VKKLSFPFSLHNKSEAFLFSGQGLSLIGTWMTRVAVGWMVFRLTGSAWMLGLIGFTGQIPSLLLGPLAGAIVDRWGSRRVLILTQMFSMIQAFILAGLTLFNFIQIWHIVFLSLARGIINAIDAPARETLLMEIAEPEAPARKTSLNSALVNAARLIGPSIAGLVIAASGEAYCFLIDGLSYLAAILPLFGLKIYTAKKRSASNLFRDVVDGWVYVSGCLPLRPVLLLMLVICMTGMPFTILLPLFAASIVNGGPHALGILLSASGCGALTGALCLGRRCDTDCLLRTIPFSAVSFGAGLIAFSRVTLLLPAVGFIFVASFSMMQYLGRSSLFLKTSADESIRGRVMSYYTMAFMGMPPVGCLLAGSLAANVGSSSALLYSGVICIAGAILFVLRLPRFAFSPVVCSQ
jgi:MFS family permease